MDTRHDDYKLVAFVVLLAMMEGNDARMTSDSGSQWLELGHEVDAVKGERRRRL